MGGGGGTAGSTPSGLARQFAVGRGLTRRDAVRTTGNAVLSVVALGAGVFTAVARKNSLIQPLALTAEAALAHPANIETAVVVKELAANPTSHPWSINMSETPPNKPQNPTPPPKPGK